MSRSSVICNSQELYPRLLKMRKRRSETVGSRIVKSEKALTYVIDDPVL